MFREDKEMREVKFTKYVKVGDFAKLPINVTLYTEYERDRASFLALEDAIKQLEVTVVDKQ